MKVKRLVIVLILVAVAFIAVMLPSAISAERQKREWIRTVRALQGLSHDRVAAAVEAFMSSRKASTASLPATVTFAELVSRGYLRTNEVMAFAGKEVVVSLGIVDPAPSQAILIRVRMANGRDVVAMGDGSIMMMPNKSLQPTATAPSDSTKP